MTTLEKILDTVSHLEPDKQAAVLNFAEQLQTPTKHSSARELMKLPFEERDAIIRAQLELSANEGFETFEAYSEEDFDATP